jgi:hypothetical protein
MESIQDMEAEEHVRVPMEQIRELIRFCNKYAPNDCEGCPMRPFRDDWNKECMISKVTYNPIHRNEE